MSLTEAKFEEQPFPTRDGGDLVTDLVLDGIAQFPVDLTSGSMTDGDIVAQRLASVLSDPLLRGHNVDIGMVQDATKSTRYLVTFTLNQLLG